MRACLVLIIAAVAITTPYFGSVLGTIGGLTDALQAFVLPSLIFMNGWKWTSASTLEACYYWCILAWGISIMVVTFAQLVYNIVY